MPLTPEEAIDLELAEQIRLKREKEKQQRFDAICEEIDRFIKDIFFDGNKKTWEIPNSNWNLNGQKHKLIDLYRSYGWNLSYGCHLKKDLYYFTIGPIESPKNHTKELVEPRHKQPWYAFWR